MTKSFILKCLLSLVLGAIAVFSYSPFTFWPVAYISFTGLLLLVNQKTIKQAALIGFAWGFGYFLAGVNWVYISIKQYGELSTSLSILILMLLIAYLSIYPMIFAILTRLLNKIFPAYSLKQLVYLAPMLWLLTQYLRCTILNGFAWLQFGYSQLESPLSGWFPILGIDGVNLIFSICCGFFAIIFYPIFYRERHNRIIKKRHVYSAACAIMVIFFASLWVKAIHWTQIDDSRQTKVTLVQGNITQSLRWNPSQLDNTLKTYQQLTEQNLKNSDIIIWPEAAITDLEINQQYYLKYLDDLAIKNDTAITVGIIDLQHNKMKSEVYNALIVLGDSSPYQYPTSNRYLKHHLVPFGEYTPFQSVLMPIANLLSIPMSSMSAGPAKQKPLLMKGFNFSTVICYEVVLSDLVWQNFDERSDFLLTVSNDAWFGNSIGPWQHLQMARARALEFGRTLIRSTNNGVTAIITPEGLISNHIPQFQRNTLTATISPSVGLTPYAKWGKHFYYAILLFLAIMILFVKKP